MATTAVIPTRIMREIASVGNIRAIRDVQDVFSVQLQEQIKIQSILDIKNIAGGQQSSKNKT